MLSPTNAASRSGPRRERLGRQPSGQPSGQPRQPASSSAGKRANNRRRLRAKIPRILFRWRSKRPSPKIVVRNTRHRVGSRLSLAANFQQSEIEPAERRQTYRLSMVNQTTRPMEIRSHSQSHDPKQPQHGMNLHHNQTSEPSEPNEPKEGTPATTNQTPNVPNDPNDPTPTRTVPQAENTKRTKPQANTTNDLKCDQPTRNQPTRTQTATKQTNCNQTTKLQPNKQTATKQTNCNQTNKQPPNQPTNQPTNDTRSTPTTTVSSCRRHSFVIVSE